MTYALAAFLLKFKYLCFMGIKELEKEIVLRLRTLNPEKIILFGSLAYGTHHVNSDLDLCIITNSKFSKSQLKREVRFLLKGLSIAKDILTPTIDEYAFYKNEIGSVYKEIDRKGKVLWQSS